MVKRIIVNKRVMTQTCKEKVLASHLCARFLCFSEPTTIETLNPYFNIVSGHPAQLGTRYKLWGLVRDQRHLQDGMLIQ